MKRKQTVSCFQWYKRKRWSGALWDSLWWKLWDTLTKVITLWRRLTRKCRRWGNRSISHHWAFNSNYLWKCRIRKICSIAEPCLCLAICRVLSRKSIPSWKKGRVWMSRWNLIALETLGKSGRRTQIVRESCLRPSICFNQKRSWKKIQSKGRSSLKRKQANSTKTWSLLN